MKKKNIIMISFDEVRPDHLSCYGYGKKTTPNVDRIAENGVVFENCIAAGCFTPICMSSVLTGCYPNKHTVRDPYCTIQRPTIAEILKGNGYLTAGFSGNGVLGSAHGFGKGFASYDEPDDREGHHFDTWQPDATREVFYGGNWWVDRVRRVAGRAPRRAAVLRLGPPLPHAPRRRGPPARVGQAEKAGQPLDVLLRREARPLRRRSHRPHDGQPEELGHVGGHHARLLQRPRHQPRRPSGRAAVLPPARAGAATSTSTTSTSGPPASSRTPTCRRACASRARRARSTSSPRSFDLAGIPADMYHMDGSSLGAA